MAVVSLLPGLLIGGPIVLEGRTVLMAHPPSGDFPAPKELLYTNKGREAVVLFEVSQEAAGPGTRFALWAQMRVHEAAPRFSIEGRPVELTPLRRRDGWVTRIPAGFLRPGENRLTIISGSDQPLELESLAIFSLWDTFEEVHFGRAFGDMERGLSVQPPIDPAQADYDALHYSLSIRLNMYSTRIEATLTCTGRVLADGFGEVVLDLDSNNGQLAVTSVDGGEESDPLVYEIVGDRLRITLPESLSTSDTFRVRVAYSGFPATGKIFADAYNRTTHSGYPVIYTFSEPYGARQWWPCKDVPEDKATMDLRIAVQDPYFPVTNGRLVTAITQGGGFTEYYYREDFPLATYLVSICCTNYAFVSGTYTALDGQTTMPVGHYLYPENVAREGDAVNGTLEAMYYLAETFGEYPFLTEKYVTASHNDGAGMEHQTCTSMPARDLDEGGLGRRNIHELAHMWFGDQVTMDHFDHLWLNEGFATYCEALFYENKYGRPYYRQYVNAWDTSSRPINDTTPLVNPNADWFSSALVYRKGAFVLHMLRRVVGDEIFFQSCRQYLQNHSYGTALTEDLRAAFEAEYGQDLSWFFDQWVYRAGRPQYLWSWNQMTEPDGDGMALFLRIDQAQSGDPFVMPIEVRILRQSAEAETVRVWNDRKTQLFRIHVDTNNITSVEFDPENYVLKRATAVGFAGPRALILQ
jgi:aminopeptidase N